MTPYKYPVNLAVAQLTLIEAELNRKKCQKKSVIGHKRARELTNKTTKPREVCDDFCPGT